MIIICLLLLGLCLGSFINALVFRLHWQLKNSRKSQIANRKYSIVSGRSMCPKCEHRLAWYDNIPVFSWVVLRGKCRYCKKPIHWQYPAVELATAFLFTISYIYWPQAVNGLEIIQFSLWLAVLVGLIALLVYDLRWMLLPNRIIFPLYGLAAIYMALEAIQISSFKPLALAILGIAIGGGIFYVLFQASNGRWIGGGDVKLGFLLGALVGAPLQAMLMLFIASLLGCFAAIPLLATKQANRDTRIPFGPFLIAAAIVVVLFGQALTDWYLETLTFGL